MEEATDFTIGQQMTNREFEDFVKNAYPELYARWVAGPRVEPGIISTHCRDAEEIVTIYGALRTYLKILSQQPEEDLETIARVTRLMIAIKPQAVEASQEIAGREK